MEKNMSEEIDNLQDTPNGQQVYVVYFDRWNGQALICDVFTDKTSVEGMLETWKNFAEGKYPDVDDPNAQDDTDKMINPSFIEKMSEYWPNAKTFFTENGLFYEEEDYLTYSIREIFE